MYKDLERNSAVHFEATRSTATSDEAGVHLAENPFLGHLNLRGDPANKSFREGASKALGTTIPVKPNTVSKDDNTTVVWLGPNEWLVITPPGQESMISDSLHKDLDGIHSSVTDVTGGHTVLTIKGQHARNTLSKDCSLDIHPRVFGPGQCAQTLIAKVGVTIVHNENSPSYDLIVRRSFAEYLGQWLQDAAQEYGINMVDHSRSQYPKSVNRDGIDVKNG